jgi:DNA adenine methylase
MKTITALAPWYGSNRTNSQSAGKLLEGCQWVAIPFAGGMCELPHIRARTIMANDLHRGIINLAREVATNCLALQTKLRSQLFHPDSLANAQRQFFSKSDESDALPDSFNKAVHYFTIAWMTRSSTAGTNGEKRGKLALRWDAGGGDSAKRYHSAINALEDWCNHFHRCTFTCWDAFEFLDKCKDRSQHGIYCDPPFFGPGDKYIHHCGKEQQDQRTWHARLAERLAQFNHTRVVVRAYDDRFVHELYPNDQWTWHEFTGRKQTNVDAAEVLLVKN